MLEGLARTGIEIWYWTAAPLSFGANTIDGPITSSEVNDAVVSNAKRATILLGRMLVGEILALRNYEKGWPPLPPELAIFGVAYFALNFLDLANVVRKTKWKNILNARRNFNKDSESQ